ncbi:PEP-CTERM sorting domain-containing protein [Fischerella thermalis CCMEE 5268]|uniref:PEP-CTERM sorting domain-containing protein n=1 Tax=Fischerella thermalis CCMEE 5268 TaxID=2019662 RepID=A0A2N6KEW4_9CYAN|nr:NF038130 family PEP-CTERM protein [Fischerella thermalis]PLZ97595.1 PEP-CTERM sorting domain-containing protein [Fischerella thermalis CCMEE 5268]
MTGVKNTVNRLLIGVSMVAGMSAIATSPAHAVDFTFNNSNEINTYTGGSNGIFIGKDTTAATNALTDGDASSNVELWYSSETPTANVGFTATEGNYSATVSSVTANDWKEFGSQWLDDLLNAYQPFQSVWNAFSSNTKSMITSFLPSLGMGDPNIGGFQFGENGGVQLQLVGHLDLKTKLLDQINTLLKLPSVLLPQAQRTDLTNLKNALNAYQGQIAASEIAKVVTGGKTYYAYSFSGIASGITASDDGKSYNAIFNWSTPDYVAKAPPKSVPEPSVMLGLLSIAGVFVTQRQLKKAQA